MPRPNYIMPKPKIRGKTFDPLKRVKPVNTMFQREGGAHEHPEYGRFQSMLEPKQIGQNGVLTLSERGKPFVLRFRGKAHPGRMVTIHRYTKCMLVVDIETDKILRKIPVSKIPKK